MSKETKLKIKILRSGKSRAELAEAVGIKYSTLSQYLNGYIKMPDGVKERLHKEIDRK